MLHRGQRVHDEMLGASGSRTLDQAVHPAAAEPSRAPRRRHEQTAHLAHRRRDGARRHTTCGGRIARRDQREAGACVERAELNQLRADVIEPRTHLGGRRKLFTGPRYAPNDRRTIATSEAGDSTPIWIMTTTLRRARRCADFKSLLECRGVGRHLLARFPPDHGGNEKAPDAVAVEVDGDREACPRVGERIDGEIDEGPDRTVDGSSSASHAFEHSVETLVSTYVGALDDEEHTANRRIDTYLQPGDPTAICSQPRRTPAILGDRSPTLVS